MINFFVQMKLNKFAYLYSKPLGNHNEKNTLKFTLKKPGKIMEISWNFVSPKKSEPCLGPYPGGGWGSGWGVSRPTPGGGVQAWGGVYTSMH